MGSIAAAENHPGRVIYAGKLFRSRTNTTFSAQENFVSEQLWPSTGRKRRGGFHPFGHNRNEIGRVVKKCRRW